MEITIDALNIATHNATITLTSPKTGQHRTFKVSTIRNGNLEGKRIASLLIGPDNTSDYRGFGFVQDDGTIAVWRKDRGTIFDAYADMLMRPSYWASRGVTYQTSGRCRRCNRKLTVPESIATGLGPECAGKF